MTIITGRSVPSANGQYTAFTQKSILHFPHSAAVRQMHLSG